MFERLSAAEVIATLDLAPHPEGGHFKEIHRHVPNADGADDGGRGWVTSIYFLLKTGERSHWHRVHDGDEVWCFHAGQPLELAIHPEGGARETHILGLELEMGHRPQAVVPANAWQAARPLHGGAEGGWTLVGCQVAPAFEFSSFELAPPDFEPS